MLAADGVFSFTNIIVQQVASAVDNAF